MTISQQAGFWHLLVAIVPAHPPGLPLPVTNTDRCWLAPQESKTTTHQPESMDGFTCWQQFLATLSIASSACHGGDIIVLAAELRSACCIPEGWVSLHSALSRGSAGLNPSKSFCKSCWINLGTIYTWEMGISLHQTWKSPSKHIL